MDSHPPQRVHDSQPDRAGQRDGDLAAHALEVDAHRYACPPGLARRLDALLAPDAASRILLLNGPGGSGKSAALREAARRGASAGYEVHRLDGRELVGSRLPDAVGQLPAGPVLLLIDEVDALGAGAHALGHAVARLPASSRVAAAARTHPPGWLPSHLAPTVTAAAVPRLTTDESDEVLRRHGITEPTARQLLCQWALGFPLALVMCAMAWLEYGDELTRRQLGASTATALIEVISGPALEQLDDELLEAAALTGYVDGPMLDDLLPTRNGTEAVGELLQFPFTERASTGVRLHPLVARMVRERIRRDGSRLSPLVLRAASHLRERGRTDPDAMHHLALLIEDPGLRAGLVPDASASLYIDDVRTSDIDTICAWAPPATHEALRAWLEPGPPDSWRTPSQVVRHADGRCLAAAAALPLAEAAAIVRTGEPRARLVAPLVDQARAMGITDRLVISPFQLMAPDAMAEDPNVAPFRNASALRACRVPNPRYDLVNEFGWTDTERQIAAEVGYCRVPEADHSIGGEAVLGWHVDLGPGGLVGLLFAGIAAEHGIDIDIAIDPAATALAALDGFNEDSVLAVLPAAPLGHSVPDAADRVRVWLRRLVGTALRGDPELFTLVDQRYLSGPTTHDAVMQATYLSRATYFRRLRTARDLIARAADGS